MIIGTAGHIDHGKTTLVKKLTGHDTDRLKEEKDRGVTIEVGFAPLKLKNGSTLSIVDVPGHEKFIKNMVAGAGSIDLGLLVIDAKEGVMAQTIEHIHILSMLGISKLIVVITKIDLVDSITLKNRQEALKKWLKQTPYKEAPIYNVSSYTGEGIDNLVCCIEQAFDEACQRKYKELVQLPIDRVFSMKGHGTIVTGTLLGGNLSLKQEVSVLPKGITCKVRQIQVRGEYVETVAAGERCAINLSKIEPSQITRGDVLTQPNGVEATMLIDVALYNLLGDPLMHNQPIHLHIGTKHVLGRLRIIGANTIHKRCEGFAQIRLSEPVLALRGDAFIIRGGEPLTTIGGGNVLNTSGTFGSRYKHELIEQFKVLQKGDIGQMVEAILTYNHAILTPLELALKLAVNQQDLQHILEQGVHEGGLMKLSGCDSYVSSRTYNDYVDKLQAGLEQFYKQHPYQFKANVEQLKSKLTQYNYSNSTSTFNELLEEIITNKYQRDEERCWEKGDRIIERIHQRPSLKKMEKHLLDDSIILFHIEALQEDLKLNDHIFNASLQFLITTGRIIDVDEKYVIHQRLLDQVIEEVMAMFEHQEAITVKEVRDRLKIGRKAVILILEALDRQNITKRHDNYRVKA